MCVCANNNHSVLLYLPCLRASLGLYNYSTCPSSIYHYTKAATYISTYRSNAMQCYPYVCVYVPFHPLQYYPYVCVHVPFHSLYYCNIILMYVCMYTFPVLRVS